MKNIAVIELDMMSIKLTIASVVKNSVVVLNQVTEPLNFVDDLMADEIIKAPKINETIEICQSFKSLCDAYEVVETTCLSHRKFYDFKNEVSFYEQIYAKCGLKFKEMTEEWLDFIIACRSGQQHDYDIVIGAMADDQIYNFVTDYMDGVITREQFWALARFKYPTHQIVFCTDEALECLQYRGYEEVL